MQCIRIAIVFNSGATQIFHIEKDKPDTVVDNEDLKGLTKALTGTNGVTDFTAFDLVHRAAFTVKIANVDSASAGLAEI